MAPAKKGGGGTKKTTTPVKKAPTKATATDKKVAAKSTKQQTLADSLKKTSLRRKEKTVRKPATSRSENEGKEEGDDEEDGQGMNDDGDMAMEVESDGEQKELTPKPSTRTRRTDEETKRENDDVSIRLDRDAFSSQRVQRGTVNADEVLTGSYLLSAGNSSDLSRRLKQTWMALQQTANQHQEEDVPLEKLRLVCAELLHEKIMDHAEKNVRSLSACCFVELLRVYAPDMPFKSNEELYDAFQLILEQLRCLAIEGNDETASSTDLHYFYILESLATVKSCLLLIGMDFTPDDGDEPLMIQLFRTFFSTIRKEHSVKIENLMLSVMVSCIEESDTIEQSLLDVILAPLVHSATNTEGTISSEGTVTDSSERGPYHMAQELIRRTSDQLQSHLSHFFNSILVDAASSLTHKTSELKEHVYTLIYEVHKINSSLLLYVLPNVCMQLQVDEVATRSEAIALMGRLFASTHADYGHDYMKNFRDFLGRFRDVSKEIRLQMVQVSAIIWQRKPELASLIEKEFIQRLSDPDWEVRRLVVNEVCDLAANNLETVSEVCLREVGERMKDKKVVLRKETMTGLSQVYAAHISAYWASEEEVDEEANVDISITNEVPQPNAKKLAWVPDFVLKCFAYPQQELKLRVVQLLDDILLPKAHNEFDRAKGLLYILHSLDPTSKEALRRILSERAKCQVLVSTFLRAKKLARGQQGKNADASSTSLDKAKDVLQAGLAPVFTETDNLSKLLDQLVKFKDQSVFKQLEILCDCTKTQQDVRNARDRLIKSVGSKTALGEFMKNLCRKLNQLTISQGSIAAYLSFFDHNGSLPHRQNRSIVDLLSMVSKLMPQVFAPFVREEFETVLVGDSEDNNEKDIEDEDSQRDQKLVVGLLSILACYSDYWKRNQVDAFDDIDKDDQDSTPSDALKKFLHQCCLGGPKTRTSGDDGASAKYAAQILANFFGESKEMTLLMTRLCSKKSLGSPQAPNALLTLQSLNVFAKRCASQVSDTMLMGMWQLLMDEFVVQASSTGSDQTPSKSKRSKGGQTVSRAADVRCLAIKVVTNILLHRPDGGDIDRSRSLVNVLFDVLRSDGRMWGSSGSLPTKFRSCAARALLKLVRDRAIEATLTVREWHLLGFVMQDTSEDVRVAFLKRLTANLMKKTVPHPHKYLSYLALAATDSSGVQKKNARGLLAVAIERMRKVFEASSAQWNGDGVDTTGEDDDDARHNVNALMVPEYALPYLVHLLAHHPDYPTELAGKPSSILHDSEWSDQVAYLSFFLDGLVPSHGVTGDNIAFLLQILTKISECHDVTAPGSKAIYPLVESAVGLVKRRIKNQSNLKAFPGKIYLPKQLYAAGKLPSSGNTKASSEDEHSSLRKGPRISTSLSPIKALGAGNAFLSMGSPPASSKKRRSSPVVSSRRRSLKVDDLETPTKEKAISGTPAKPTPTPPRRQSLMRQARVQSKTFVDQSSDSGDDSDDFVVGASVASRANKRESSNVVRRISTTPASKHDDSDTAESPVANKRRRTMPDEETKGESEPDDDDDEEMVSAD